jgi:hypothetical protein
MNRSYKFVMVRKCPMPKILQVDGRRTVFLDKNELDLSLTRGQNKTKRQSVLDATKRVKNHKLGKGSRTVLRKKTA